ncbi:MAG: guanosine monophosphate reductase [Bdellovibrionales bacterium]|nr:guanosine monophosphate reductase [Bdellovibrionales bacterium]
MFFNSLEIKNRSRALTFSDVLLVPKKSEMISRTVPDLTTSLTKKQKITSPFISSNMDTVTESGMILAMNNLGATGILHRFMTIENQLKEIEKIKSLKIKIASVGVNKDSKDRCAKLVDAGVNIITIDIAHGHSTQMIEMLTWIKKEFSDIEVIAGNVATPQATKDLINCGADAIKVGIGPGSMCTTRIITGCGVPQLTAIAICAEEAKKHNVPIIADGGIKTSGDVVKAFAAGADSVMLGSVLSGTLETPGLIKSGQKLYRGMASRSAQDSWRGGIPEGLAPEGEMSWVPIKGNVKNVLNEFMGGLRSGMTYLNAKNIKEISKNAEFTEISSGGLQESIAHGLK